ncbi:MAG TPA: M20/M25/M40 family metallo-hydrolase, partial [Thermoanaerobaculia bacterium]|nr:M20/M25/M40 family metallo-hydrolase [Thermoanaerobaculia bacterium]
AAAPCAAEALSPAEQRLVEQIDARIDPALELLERTVNVNSGTMNFAGVREVGRLFAGEFEALGFATRWVEGAAFQRAGHLVATRAGDGPRVVLIGHLDTVFEPDSPFQRYERLSDTTARGPGVIDMKGGNVVMLEALRALAAVGALDRLHVTAVLHGDEEKSGDPLTAARADLRAAAEGALAAIGFEDGDGDPSTAVIARRGSSGWRLEVTGKPAHSSQIFRDEFGAGAIFEAARILDGFRQGLAGERDLTFNPGVILGGTEVELDSEQDRGVAFGKSNVIAERAVVEGDLRAVTPEQLERARAVMRQVAAASLPQTRAALTFDDGYPPMGASDGNRRLLALYDQASRDLGFGPVAAVDPRRAGAADVSFVAGLVEMALDGIGLMGDDGHTVDETADLTTLPSQAKRAALLLYRLATRPELAAGG